jgi:tripartite-type tricarboxylate transporter receptor subunit TctC
MVDTLASVIPAIRAGQVQALAVTTRARSPALPEVPTAAEAGLPGYETYNWHAVFAPAATPAPLLARLEAGTVAAVRAQAARLEAAGVEPRPEGAEALAAFWDQQLALWLPIIRGSGATAD